MPTQVWGADPSDPTTPILVPTPVSNGGVMCVGSTDLVEASRWNWKHGNIGTTVLGAVIDISFDFLEPPSSFVQTLSGDVYNFGITTITTGGDGTGQDFTGGDPNCSLEIGPYGSGRFVIGTSTQRLLEPPAENSTQNVHLTMTLEMEWHGIRWWDSPESGGDSFIGGFDMKLSGFIEPEDGYTWDEAQNFNTRSTEWYSNWKVSQIDELDHWGLNTRPLGGPEVVWNGGGPADVIGNADLNFVFGIDDPASADTIPIRGYDFGGAGSGGRVSIVINSMEVRFPTVLGSLPAL